MLKFLDHYLDQVTMYRLVLYYLIALVIFAGILGFFGLVPYSPIAILGSVFFLLIVCLVTNKIFSVVFKAPTNFDSAYITTLILVLILTPIANLHSIPLLFWAGVLAMSSKYILALNKKHLFNPVAIAIVLTDIGFGASASWWVGNAYMTPLIILGGLLVARKTQREDMVFAFATAAILTIGAFSFLKGSDIASVMNHTLLHSSLLFFGFVMLTEPLTTPPIKRLQILYGILVGFLFAPQIHLGSIYSTPELALVLGNVFSYIVSPKQKLLLYLREKIQVAPDIIDFVFGLDKPLAFAPGQYMEFTFAHPHTDSRGSRRYFTLASSPTEDTLRLGVKFYEKGSSFKKSLSSLSKIVPVIAAQLSGEFTLPKDKNRKLVFVAGGIGVTPFRSIVKYLLDTKEMRSIVILYANKIATDIVYREIFDQAGRELGIKTVYTLTDKEHVPIDWQGRVGRIDAKMIEEEIPDWKERYFYLSGPHTMVTSYEEVLTQMGLPRPQIKKDFFPGFV